MSTVCEAEAKQMETVSMIQQMVKAGSYRDENYEILDHERAYVEERRQFSGAPWGSGSFGGPDTYVAIQLVPAGVKRLKVLRQDLAEKRGISIWRVGEGYSEHDGPRSSLGCALAEAIEEVCLSNGEYYAIEWADGRRTYWLAYEAALQSARCGYPDAVISHDGDCTTCWADGDKANAVATIRRHDSTVTEPQEV